VKTQLHPHTYSQTGRAYKLLACRCLLFIPKMEDMVGLRRSYIRTHIHKQVVRTNFLLAGASYLYQKWRAWWGEDAVTSAHNSQTCHAYKLRACRCLLFIPKMEDMVGWGSSYICTHYHKLIVYTPFQVYPLFHAGEVKTWGDKQRKDTKYTKFRVF
jgi:hypothetical protein